MAMCLWCFMVATNNDGCNKQSVLMLRGTFHNVCFAHDREVNSCRPSVATHCKVDRSVAPCSRELFIESRKSTTHLDLGGGSGSVVWNRPKRPRASGASCLQSLQRNDSVCSTVATSMIVRLLPHQLTDDFLENMRVKPRGNAHVTHTLEHLEAPLIVNTYFCGLDAPIFALKLITVLF